MADNKAKNFSEWLVEQGHDETKMDNDRRNQLMSFYKDKLLQPPAPESKDADGSPIAIGDLVTITYRISGIHRTIDPETGREAGTSLNLNHILSDGTERHDHSVPSTHVKKAK